MSEATTPIRRHRPQPHLVDDDKDTGAGVFPKLPATPPLPLKRRLDFGGTEPPPPSSGIPWVRLSVLVGLVALTVFYAKYGKGKS